MPGSARIPLLLSYRPIGEPVLLKFSILIARPVSRICATSQAIPPFDGSTGPRGGSSRQPGQVNDGNVILLLDIFLRLVYWLSFNRP